MPYYLDLEKRLSRQVGLNLSDPLLKFVVKFYTPDPSQLEEEFTRYLFSLQVKRDLATGVLSCNDNTAALMASFIVQGEVQMKSPFWPFFLGLFLRRDFFAFFSTFFYFPSRMRGLFRRGLPWRELFIRLQIRTASELRFREENSRVPQEAHWTIPSGSGFAFVGDCEEDWDVWGSLPSCEGKFRLQVLRTDAKISFSQDEDGVHLSLAVCHMGVLVFQNGTKINAFSWAKIRKISFKRKRFILKLHPETYVSFLIIFLFSLLIFYFIHAAKVSRGKKL